MTGIKNVAKMIFFVTVIALLTTSLVFAEDIIKGDELIGFSTERTSYTTPDDISKITRTAFESSFWGPNITTLNIGKGVKEVGHFTFYYSYDETPKLETVNMEDVEIIGDFAFGGLKYLKIVQTANELKEIKSAAFTNILALKSIDLQKLEKLGNQAFEGSGLVEVTVPGTVKVVEFQAFNLMPNLEKVVVEEGVEELQKYAFQSYKFKEIHLPKSLIKIDDFAISGNKGGLTIFAPSGSYAEEWAKSKGFTVNSSTSIKPTIPANTTQPTQPTQPLTASEMTPFNYTDKNVALNTEWGLGKSKNVVKVEEENIIIHNSPHLSGVYKVETWNKDSYATHKYKYYGYHISDQFIYVKKDGELHLAFSKEEGLFEHRVEVYGTDPVSGYRALAGVIVPRPSFEVYIGSQPNTLIPATDERWTEKDIGEVYVLIDFAISHDSEMINVTREKRLIKLDLSTGTYPEPIKTERTEFSEMTADNYTAPEIIKTAKRGFHESKNVVKVEKEYLNFNEDTFPFKDGVWDVETWNKDTYITYMAGVSNESINLSCNYFLKINGELYTGGSNGSVEVTSFGYTPTQAHENESGLAESIESALVRMKPEFSAYKYNYANPFDTGTQRWTEKNVGEVYVVMETYYLPYKFHSGPYHGVLMPSLYFNDYKVIKLDISDKSTSTGSNIKTALQTSSKVIVNGEEVRFSAYNINGNNYFKLRDIAIAVNKTNKQFAVKWDGTKNSINLISNSKYEPTHSELIPGSGETKIARPTTSNLYKDGSLLSWVGYNIDDNNYYKLRDIGKAFNIGITWDNTTQTVGIDTSIDYSE